MEIRVNSGGACHTVTVVEIQLRTGTYAAVSSAATAIAGAAEAWRSTCTNCCRSSVWHGVGAGFGLWQQLWSDCCAANLFGQDRQLPQSIAATARVTINALEIFPIHPQFIATLLKNATDIQALLAQTRENDTKTGQAKQRWPCGPPKMAKTRVNRFLTATLRRRFLGWSVGIGAFFASGVGARGRGNLPWLGGLVVRSVDSQLRLEPPCVAPIAATATNPRARRLKQRF